MHNFVNCINGTWNNIFTKPIYRKSTLNWSIAKEVIWLRNEIFKLLDHRAKNNVMLMPNPSINKVRSTRHPWNQLYMPFFPSYVLTMAVQVVEFKTGCTKLENNGELITTPSMIKVGSISGINLTGRFFVICACFSIFLLCS